ncbi:MAG: ABC transporter permease [Saprospiraceae bacterium]|nr:ABC transporter permease [Saprospiraceae bacterium]MCB9325201.1 ABC transporter permease [Lewinellaceae bacterium]
MRTIFIILKKELLQVFRNKAMLPILTVIPIVQLILLSYAASNEVKNLGLVIYDADHSDYSRQLRDKFAASGYFVLKAMTDDMEGADVLLQSDEADIVLNIPAGFERDLLRNQVTEVQLRVNAINGSKGGLAGSYAATVIGDFNKQKLPEALRTASVRVQKMPGFNVTFSNWYNPTLDYKIFMVPGILAALVTILTLLLSAMNVVREKELGTIEQINVTPILKYQFIIGKLIPFLFIGLFDLVLGLAFAKLFFNIPIVGDLWLIFAFCIVNIIAILGIGLLISTTADTQQQAMFIAWFFMMIFLLMGGLFTPVESMPKWAQYFTVPNPIYHFVEVMRMVMLKGSGFQDIKQHFYIMGGLAVGINALAVWTYRKRG